MRDRSDHEKVPGRPWTTPRDDEHCGLDVPYKVHAGTDLSLRQEREQDLSEVVRPSRCSLMNGGLTLF